MTCGDATIQDGCNEDCVFGDVAADDGCSPVCRCEPCGPTPDPTCRETFVPGRAMVRISNADDPERASIQWKWSNGSETLRAEFGAPLTLDSYYVCIYDAGSLVSTTFIPASGVCAGKACWRGKVSGFFYRDKEGTPDGADSLKLGGGSDGKAKIGFRARGSLLDLPEPAFLQGPLVVQLVKATDEPPCWSATYSAPFDKSSGTSMSDRAD